MQKKVSFVTESISICWNQKNGRVRSCVAFVCYINFLTAWSMWIAYIVNVWDDIDASIISAIFHISVKVIWELGTDAKCYGSVILLSWCEFSISHFKNEYKINDDGNFFKRRTHTPAPHSRVCNRIQSYYKCD